MKEQLKEYISLIDKHLDEYIPGSSSLPVFLEPLPHDHSSCTAA